MPVLRPVTVQGECEAQICQDRSQPTSYCEQCNCNYCEACWPEQAPHRPDKRAQPGRHPHEPTDRYVSARLEQILNPTTDQEKQAALHREDSKTTWFGIVKDKIEGTVFQDYGRYIYLMQETFYPGLSVRYPQLASFIGRTGDGKSSIVKMLIDHQEMVQNYEALPQSASAASPVVGSPVSHTPTSGDVHLYSDPGSIFSSYPILYADCEGLEAGEVAPASSRNLPIDRTEAPGVAIPTAIKQRFSKVFRSRKLRWADTAERMKREFAVSTLYPKLLYTFSDVIVFVLQNTRTFQSVLGRLLEWADANWDKSINQPTLSHVIIVVNFTDPWLEDEFWDVDRATDLLMSDFDRVIHEVQAFGRLKSRWQRKGKPINSVKDLLLCYYSSVRVVRLPIKGRYALMNNQIAKLYDEIELCCKVSFEAKRKSRMTTNSDDLQLYLTAAFDHFSKNLTDPFNFVDVSLDIRPISRTLGDNMVQLAVAMKRNPTLFMTGERIFLELARFVAPCVFLDIVRRRLKSTAEELFNNRYWHHCEYALLMFINKHWPCSFTKDDSRCVNMRYTHIKGHQDANGKLLAPGPYSSDFSYTRFKPKWEAILRVQLDEIQNSFNQETSVDSTETEEDHAASRLHRLYMNEFYQTIGPASHYISHSFCLSCLHDLPEHPLHCGHVLCTACITNFGDSEVPGRISLEECPLHLHDKFPQTWNIRVKPPLAGVRCLALDGGGIRGIVELEVLKAIQKFLPPGIPVEHFFDVVAGTNTGGIVALGLCANHWSIDESIERFKTLCSHAFKPREFHSIQHAWELAGLSHGSLYKTKPFENILRNTFSDRKLFGGVHNHNNMSVKVIVTATTATLQRPILITNYNRRPHAAVQTDWDLERPDEPQKELEIWEAARATSAAPGYFKSFSHEKTNKNYLDGALYHSNPAKLVDFERKLIWPDTKDLAPDLLLSIGTGCNAHIISDANDVAVAQEKAPIARTQFQLLEQNRAHKKVWKLFKIGQVLRTLKNRIDNITNTEVTWNRFLQDSWTRDKDIRERYIRLNPDIKAVPPKFDDLGRLASLQEATQKSLLTVAEQSKVREIAYRLVASTFYFEQYSVRAFDGQRECTGEILCRDQSGTRELRNLGHFFKTLSIPYFEPKFIVSQRRDQDTEIKEFHLLASIVDRMIADTEFRLGEFSISIPTEQTVTAIELALTPKDVYPISGFPRALLMAKGNSRGIQLDDCESFQSRSDDWLDVDDELENYPTEIMGASLISTSDDRDYSSKILIQDMEFESSSS